MTPLLTAPATNLENEASLTGLTLSEVVSLVALIADGEHISGYLWNDNRLDSSFGFVEEIQRLEERDGTLPAVTSSNKAWHKLLTDRLAQKRDMSSGYAQRNPLNSLIVKGVKLTSDEIDELPQTFCPENPAITAIFGENCGTGSAHNSTDYTSGFQFGEFEGNVEDREMLKLLLPFPALLPLFQECLISYIKKRTDHIGENMLSKLLHYWRLLDELDVLRAIYLLGSVIFTKLDKGESLDDDFKLNTISQESIRNSADNVLLRTPDSLVVSMTKNPGSSEDDNLSVSTPRKGRSQSFGIDVFDSLKFSYKIAWPLELIANLEAMKKYNQVMIFLLKVKRAKFVLDKARRWMWKYRGTATTNCKSHWLLEQKLHFVDAFHQYVMDRVYHNAWRELCEQTTVAETLDEAIELIDSCMQWGLIASCINNIFGLALDFYSVQRNLSSGGAISAIKAKCDKEVYWIEKQFDDCMAFLLRILSVNLNVRQFPYLAALGTHINYNYYHMSKSRFLTASSSRNLHST
ncbi:gamma-tubulin complex component 5 isoform X2 [Olea europaea subsp. europaea]|uniref:Gamma-tubulin complex component n=1 Tax=Olea europaea subsp. europaea TaxID=158383 RepID=A0A8S0V4L2_OLEEU|nr:gamma-tubulin complex component 5 isoform X2 [Olea europaea subsp. europaea]